MENFNLVMPVCMLKKTTAYCNVLVCSLSTPKILSLCRDRLIVSMMNPQLQNPSFIDTKTLLSYGGSG